MGSAAILARGVTAQVSLLSGLYARPTAIPDDDKRILAAELNVARRHLTDAQQIELGRTIEPDVAERARLRMLATQNNDAAAAARSSGQMAPAEARGRTRDDVAQTVGLGSGRTYERGKKVMETAERVGRHRPEVAAVVTAAKIGQVALKDVKNAIAQAKQAEERECAGRKVDPTP